MTSKKGEERKIRKPLRASIWPSVRVDRNLSSDRVFFRMTRDCMMKLPNTSKEFLDHYWLKEELVRICEENKLPKNGSKRDLLGYIADFLDKKPILRIDPAPRPKSAILNITPSMVIDENYSNDENHRRFFMAEIGPAFKYNVRFMTWMKEQKGKKTYGEAIDEWKRIDGEKKRGYKTVIGKQFEYNQYTRDFFLNNRGRTKEECIQCWNYKKRKAGSHAYEDSDLIALDERTRNGADAQNADRPAGCL
jgi:hypothetical protein